ncbi:hypothetical protein [Halobacillus sp. Marseille-Q1614]|uniref:hypothetical protein n=1 Tax=Halobacillus sp. Marseille-Q1614 TaxID=2709134 RepID=UPI00156FDCFA|nr:hypothetical protein [Halobacillus sp. Marseille-Q1614]
MQAKNLTGGQELLCINTEKVYDWVINEATFDLTLGDFDLPLGPTGDPITCDDIAENGISCEVAPLDTVILGREEVEIPVGDTVVTLQLVNIQKTFEVTISVQLIAELGGGTVEVGTATFTRCEQVLLCAPEGTDVEVTYTDLSCFVCTATCVENGTEGDELTDITVTVRLCQSIQSTFDVTLEIVADFCAPREQLQLPACPAPTMPPQCPVIFPNGDNGDNG